MKSKVTFNNALMHLLPLVLAAICHQTLLGQDSISVRIGCSVADGRDAVVTDLFADKGTALPTSLRFYGATAGFPIPSSRVLSVKAQFAAKEVDVKQMGPLDFVVEGDYTRLSVTQLLSEPRSVDEAAFRSWSADGVRMLFLEDLLPALSAEGGGMPVRVKVMCGGDSSSAYAANFADHRDAVVLAGGSSDGFAGTWPFPKSDADAMASEILVHYSKNVFGTSPPPARFLFARLPAEKFGRDRWAAQVTGSTVLIVSTGTQFPTQEKQRLHEQLRHEIFHLWFPHLAGLKGKYDWFYEGFALYESLKYAVNSNRITFDDFLSSLNGAYGIASRGAAVSLISLSETRFVGSERQLYAKGMLAAFFTDVAMLDASGGKRSSSQLVRDVFFRSQKSKGAMADDLILREFTERAELKPVADSYISGTASIATNPYFGKAGLSLVDTKLRTVQKPSGRQKAVLDKLGYNAWRKTLR